MGDLTLYELAGEYRTVLDALTDPQVDLPEEAVADTLESLAAPLEEKATNVAKFMRNLEATAEAIRKAETAMAHRRRTIENRAAWLKGYLKECMEGSGITKIESPWFRLLIQKNPPAVSIDDETQLPAEYVEEVISYKIDKTGIKEKLKAGEAVDGAHLVQGTRLVIK